MGTRKITPVVAVEQGKTKTNGVWKSVQVTLLYAIFSADDLDEWRLVLLTYRNFAHTVGTTLPILQGASV